jgi:Uma2 family endonuclease
MSSAEGDSEPDEARLASDPVSAQAIETYVRTPWQPDPVRQQRADYTIEDLLDLPPDTPRVELSHGVMLVVPSPSVQHQVISARLWSWFDDNAPRQFEPVPAVGVAVAVDHTFEPDVILMRAEVDEHRHFLKPSQVVVAVEIVSPGTRRRDRFTKPAEYARAGIPFYWRIEQDPVHVYAYRLASGPTYELVADSAEVLELDEPFPIKIAVPDLAVRRKIHNSGD